MEYIHLLCKLGLMEKMHEGVSGCDVCGVSCLIECFSYQTIQFTLHISLRVYIWYDVRCGVSTEQREKEV